MCFFSFYGLTTLVTVVARRASVFVPVACAVHDDDDDDEEICLIVYRESINSPSLPMSQFSKLH